MDQFKCVLDAILEASHRVTAEVDEVVDIADLYDGYNRCLFTAPPQAELGVPAVCHGLEAVGRKYRVTARHVMRAAGVNVDLSPAEARPAWPIRSCAGPTRTSPASAPNSMT